MITVIRNSFIAKEHFLASDNEWIPDYKQGVGPSLLVEVAFLLGSLLVFLPLTGRIMRMQLGVV